jgi:hypothetical protein
MQPFASSREKSRDRALCGERRDEFDLRSAGPEKGDPDSLRDEVLDGVGHQTQESVSLQRGLEILDGDAHVMNGPNHTSLRA